MKTFRMEMKYSKDDVNVVVEEYARDGSLAIRLVAADTEHNRENSIFPGEPICTASICLVDHNAQPDCFWLKNYIENEGLEAFFKKYNIASPTSRIVKINNNLSISEYKLNPEACWKEDPEAEPTTPPLVTEEESQPSLGTVQADLVDLMQELQLILEHVEDALDDDGVISSTYHDLADELGNQSDIIPKLIRHLSQLAAAAEESE
jgi:hypothetical protein